MFHSALICTDFTDGLYRLVRFVPNLAAGGLKKLIFLHTVPLMEGAVPRPDEVKEKKARDRLSVALTTLSADVEVKIDVRSGKPTEHILDALKTYSPEVILLGTPGRSLLNEKLFGSTTINICQRTSVPVMILRPQLISTYTEEELALRCQHLFRYFLIPYDDTESSRYVIEQIKERLAAGATNLQCCLLAWIVDEVSRNERLQQNEIGHAAQVLATLKPQLEAQGVQVDTEVRAGNTVLAVMELAVEQDISAIVSASRNAGKLIELSVPSVTGELLRKSWHPMIYFPIHRK